MTKSKFIIIICLLAFIACKEKNKELYSLTNICECYSKSEFVGFDKTLSSCLTEFNAAVNKKKQETKEIDLIDFEKNHLMEMMKKLIQTCPKYQTDFNTVLLGRYSKRNRENLEKRKDSLLKVIDSIDNKAGRYIQLSELEILNGEYDKATKSINTSIELNPKMEMSYFVRGFLYYRKGDFNKAISDLKTMRKITEKGDLRLTADLWILNLEQESK